jgi:hypothetical protein
LVIGTGRVKGVPDALEQFFDGIRLLNELETFEYSGFEVQSVRIISTGEDDF